MGHGLDRDEPLDIHYHSTNLQRMVFDHLNELFPAANGVKVGSSGKAEGKNGFINGALGGTGMAALWAVGLD